MSGESWSEEKGERVTEVKRVRFRLTAAVANFCHQFPTAEFPNKPPEVPVFPPETPFVSPFLTSMF